MAARKGNRRYPRPGERIAPATLREVLLQRVPKGLAAALGPSITRLCDLDETVWQRLDREAVEELSELVVEQVASGCARRVPSERRFPRPPASLKLGDLRLEHRTRLCLSREGYEDDLRALGDHTLGEILAIRSFGPRCLVDLLSAVEARLSNNRPLDGELTREAEKLDALAEAAQLRSDDPRFAELIRGVDVEAKTARDLARRLIHRRQDPPEPHDAAEQLRRLRRRWESMSGLRLEEELIQIFASTAQERNRQIAIGYYGWADGRAHTLAEIGARYGMTRERTRQICAKLVKRKNPASIPAPVMDRALEFLDQRLPGPVGRLEKEFARAGLTGVGMSLENVARAAKLLGRKALFEMVRVGDGRLAVRSDQADVPPAIVELAKKAVYYHGVATVDQIEEAISEKLGQRIGAPLVTETLRLLKGFRWLDEKGGWFRLLPVCKHGLPKAIDKILAVTGEISVKKLRAAIGRNRRMWKSPPPEKVLLEFCRQTPGVTVRGTRIVSDPPRDWKKALTGVEARLVGILHERGPVMERGELEELCVGGGMNRFSFHAFIACSPVIAQYGHSVYGLLGAEVSPQKVQALIERRRADRSPTRVLDRHGRTDDGKVWLSYRLSKAASTYAVITVPAALKDTVTGKFRLLTTDGREVGTLAAKDGRAWGLGAHLRRQGARQNDHVLITLDLERRHAVIAVGDAPPEE